MAQEPRWLTDLLLALKPPPIKRDRITVLEMANRRETFDAMCAMRNSINEVVSMPSLESDLLQGPEDSVFCATVAQAVVGKITALEADIVKLRQLVNQAESIFTNCTVTNGTCCCGEDMENHSMAAGHSPVDQGGYQVDRWLKEARALTKEHSHAE